MKTILQICMNRLSRGQETTDEGPPERQNT